MDVTFALLADAANFSREGKLNVLGAFDRIHGSQFPLVWPRMVLVMRFVVTPAEFGSEKTLEIITLDLDGKKLGTATGKMTVPAGPSGRQLKIDHVLPLTMTFPGPGEYSIEILVNGDPKARVPLEVLPQPEAQQPPPEGGAPPPAQG
ncbi:MAG: hypothetical protein WEE64_01405 [Dehalococcoidia bacterium]